MNGDNGDPAFVPGAAHHAIELDNIPDWFFQWNIADRRLAYWHGQLAWPKHRILFKGVRLGQKGVRVVGIQPEGIGCGPQLTGEMDGCGLRQG